MDLKERIAAARAEVAEAEPAVVPVEVGGELTDITFRKVDGTTWADLTAVCPPRRGSTLDANVGFNSDAVARKYPLSHVLVDGKPLRTLDEETGEEIWDQGTWEDLNGVLSSPGVKLVAAALWGLNQNDPQKRAVELGKARTSALKKSRTSRAK